MQPLPQTVHHHAGVLTVMRSQRQGKKVGEQGHRRKSQRSEGLENTDSKDISGVAEFIEDADFSQGPTIWRDNYEEEDDGEEGSRLTAAPLRSCRKPSSCRPGLAHSGSKNVVTVGCRGWS